MTFKTIKYLSIIAVPIMIILMVFYATPEKLLQWERKYAATKVAANDHAGALKIYEFLKFQEDPIGINNYHALLYYSKINAGKKARKAQGNIADKAWNKTGRQGVGASFWNLAMFDLRSGRENNKRDKRATRYLKSAQRLGITDATPILDAGTGEHDRVHALMELGDIGAAITIADVMHHQSNTAAKNAALLIAATQGDPNAMSDLAWSLNGKDPATKIEQEKWFKQAANMGHGPAASRLGKCYMNAFYFCETVDLDQAKHWYEIAANATLIRSNPKITIDPDHAIRLGSTPRWYSKLHGTVDDARKQLAKIAVLQKTKTQ
jgi:hypothetical protein